jgi:hypothetical protein
MILLNAVFFKLRIQSDAKLQGRVFGPSAGLEACDTSGADATRLKAI